MDVKDIDFDELDRAVNSAISKNNIVNDESLTSTPVLTDDPTTNSTPTPQTTPAAPLMPSRQAISRPATGRFMDMVHSSNNMRVSVPERPTLRTVLSPIPAPALTPVSTPSVISPLQNLTSDITKNDNSDVDIDRISDEIDQTLNVTSDVQESPFLPGAKVEKRPLNAFTPQQNIDQEVLVEPIKVAPIDDMLNGQDKIETPLPAELQSDLLSIEASEVAKMDEAAIPDDFENEEPAEATDSDASQEIAEEATTESQYAPIEQNDIPTKEEAIDNITPDLTLESTSPINTQNPIVSTSIQQQYTELPDTNEKEIGSIYDTNSYHKAMAPLPKKKSGWMWIIWIALLMIVSVGAGVAVYFFVLPQL